MSSDSSATTTSGYEFTPQENAVIRKTSTLCLTWGIISIIISLIGLLMLIDEVPTDLSGWADVLIPVIVYLVVGIAFVMTARSLKATVETKGDDIANMIAAIRKLGAAFLVQIVGFAIAFAVGFIST